MESKYDEECLLTTSVKHGLSISVGINMFKAKGIMVLLYKRGI
jgi:hypothetical protein